MLRMASLHTWCPLLGAFKKIGKNLPTWFEEYYISKQCIWDTCLSTHVVSQNKVNFRIQWFFHEWLIQNSMIFPWFFHFYKFQELFMKFNDFSMILKQIWISMIFQELWEPWTSKLHVTGLWAGNSPVTGEFPAQMASNVENVSIWWHHDIGKPHQY